MQLLEDAFCSRRLPAPEQHRRPLAAQAAEKEAEERSSRSLAAHDSGSSEGDQEVQRCEVGMHHDHRNLPGAVLSTHAFAMDCISRSLAALDYGSPKGYQEAQPCKVSLLPALEKSSLPPTIGLYFVWHACASPHCSTPESSRGLIVAQICEGT